LSFLKTKGTRYDIKADTFICNLHQSQIVPVKRLN
jgi:hypothetical protein